MVTVVEVVVVVVLVVVVVVVVAALATATVGGSDFESIFTPFSCFDDGDIRDRDRERERDGDRLVLAAGEGDRLSHSPSSFSAWVDLFSGEEGFDLRPRRRRLRRFDGR